MGGICFFILYGRKVLSIMIYEKVLFLALICISGTCCMQYELYNKHTSADGFWCRALYMLWMLGCMGLCVVTSYPLAFCPFFMSLDTQMLILYCLHNLRVKMPFLVCASVISLQSDTQGLPLTSQWKRECAGWLTYKTYLSRKKKKKKGQTSV